MVVELSMLGDYPLSLIFYHCFPFGDAFYPLQWLFFLFSALQIGGSYWSGIPVRDWEKQLEEQDGCS